VDFLEVIKRCVLDPGLEDLLVDVPVDLPVDLPGAAMDT